MSNKYSDYVSDNPGLTQKEIAAVLGVAAAGAALRKLRASGDLIIIGGVGPKRKGATYHNPFNDGSEVDDLIVFDSIEEWAQFVIVIEDLRTKVQELVSETTSRIFNEVLKP